jgi:hypothetical protein
MKQLSEQEAIKMCKSKVWETWTNEKIAWFQINQKRLCIPFGVFHRAVEHVLDRPVLTHEFGLNYYGLVAEMEGKIPKPSLEDIINLIPKDKRMLIFTNKEDKE